MSVYKGVTPVGINHDTRANRTIRPVASNLDTFLSCANGRLLTVQIYYIVLAGTS